MKIQFLAALALAGCASVGPDYQTPPGPDKNARYAGTSKANTRQTLDRWWRKLGNRELNSLVDDALSANHDIAIAGQRLREARALRKQAASVFLPRGAGNASFNRIDYAGLVDDKLLAPLNRAGFLDSPIDYWGSGIDISWEIDVFGGRRRQARGARAREAATLEALHGTRLAVASEVTETYFTIAGLREQLSTLDAQIALQRRQLSDIESQVAAGAIDRLQLDRARARLESVQANRPSLQSGISSQLRRLSVLLGTPKLRNVANKPLPTRLPFVTTGIPADLVLRRPDLRRIERELAAATEDIGVAVAAFYPKFTIIGGPSTASGSLANLFEASSIYWRYGPRIDWSPFAAGANRSALEAATARQRATILAYEKAVLAAIAEVESELASLRAETERLATVQRALNATKSAVERVRKLHKAGASARLDLLIEEERLREIEITEIRVKDQMLQVWIRLHKALGGGWK